MSNIDFGPMPDKDGFFGQYGGQIIPPELKAIMDEIDQAYEEIRQLPEFQKELDMLLTDYVGRPSPLYFARRLSDKIL